MLSMLPVLWRFLRGRPDHPVYRRELAGWSYLRLWRNLRRGCLPLMLALLALGAGCCGLMTLALFAQESSTDWFYRMLLVIGAGVIGIFYVGEMTRWGVGLIATVLTATSISAEVEADTYSLMRLTLIEPREIVLAKFSAAIRELRRPLAVVMGTRAVLLVSIPLLIVSAIIYASASLVSAAPGAPSSVPAPGPAALLPASMLAVIPFVFSSALGVISLVVAVTLWLVYFFAQPWLDALLFGAVGMFASTLARTRSSGLFTAFGLRVALWVLSYVASQIASSGISIIMLPLMSLPATAAMIQDLSSSSPGLMVLAFAVASILWTIILSLGEIGVTLLLLRFATNRADRLPYNI